MDVRHEWQELRAKRAAHPGLAGTDEERRDVFTSALRQAQELADAAAAAGYATKPLMQFYCLGQGLRAVNAATETSERWRVRGHGASVITKPSVMETVIEAKPTRADDAMDAFTASQGSENKFTAPMTLGELWRASPHAPQLPDDVAADAPTALEVRRPPSPSLVEESWRAGRLDVSLQGLSPDLSDAELAAVIAKYPTLEGARPMHDVLGGIEVDGYVLDKAQATFSDRTGRLGLILIGARVGDPVVSFPLERPDRDSYDETYKRVAPVGVESREDVRLVFPAVGGCAEPPYHAVWWAVLLALSSLVRYEPSLWIAAIDPDRSGLTVPFERFCDSMEGNVPKLLNTWLEQAVELPEADR